ncbi:unnamed protein product [Phytophthora lilii]|uniref:Unnamed protein product n=1 Tax=Phytophthora lilii TaxID=2077276 RepID=A0A9W6WQI6_9STRA|nr:unnamed protein product [Phytophthora lilii]
MTQGRVGKRVRVYWSEEEEWFEGTIQDYDESQGFFVVYDDGDERWEPKGQPMLVEGEEEAQTAENYEVLTTEMGGDRAPEMMEPPASPGSNYEDEYDISLQEESQQQLESMADGKVDTFPVASESQQQDDSNRDTEGNDDYQQDKAANQYDSIQSKVNHDDTEVAEDHGNNDGVTSDGEESVAESEMPQTFGKNSTSLPGKRQSTQQPATVPVPTKGLLEGKVLRASGLQTSRALSPNPFVRVSFVESGDTTHTSALLRCKDTLSTTGIIRGSINPVWNEDLSNSFNSGNLQSSYRHEDRLNGEFQLELLPRIVPPETTPAWHQLPGDVLFTVFSATHSSSSSRSGTNEHIGQATVSLRSLLQDLLTTSPFTTRVFELRSRSGKRLGYGNTSTRSLFDDGRADTPTIVVSFRFIPMYDSKTKAKVPHPLNSTSSASRIAPPKPSSRASGRLDKYQCAKRLAPSQTSSSSINRRRFEKQIAKDNRSFAKRLEWKEARRTRRSAQEKAQEKKRVTPPQHGARKHGHKASSGINRTKYAQQVAVENKAIGKRLQNILGSDEGARNPENFINWATAEPKNSTNNDYMDRDKVHAQDKRWQRQVELDFLMEKAQTKYQQQNNIVEEVMDLQEIVASLKTQVGTMTKSVLRLDILNKKDQHVRDCLLRAAVTSGSGTTANASPRLSTLSKNASRVVPSQKSNNDQESAGATRKEQEFELLTQHRDRLRSDKQNLSQELKALNQQELDLDNERIDQQAKWDRAIATQLFHREMDKKNAIQAQKAVQEMKRRHKALELSQEEEEQWTCYQAHQELKQLQVAIQILRDQHGEEPRRLAATRASSASSSAVCDYLTQKIVRQKTKLNQLQVEVDRRRSIYREMLASGGNESLRKRVQELQRLVFLCKTQATHVKKAERVAQRKGEQVDMEFQRRMFNEQTETEIVLKRLHEP